MLVDSLGEIDPLLPGLVESGKMTKADVKGLAGWKAF